LRLPVNWAIQTTWFWNEDARSFTMTSLRTTGYGDKLALIRIGSEEGDWCGHAGAPTLEEILEEFLSDDDE